MPSFKIKYKNSSQLYKEEPFLGIGKPEALKHSLSGKWSRRINSEHRIIYSIHDDIIRGHSLKAHYK